MQLTFQHKQFVRNIIQYFKPKQSILKVYRFYTHFSSPILLIIWLLILISVKPSNILKQSVKIVKKPALERL